jgi:hypothetical protein
MMYILRSVLLSNAERVGRADFLWRFELIVNQSVSFHALQHPPSHALIRACVKPYAH